MNKHAKFFSGSDALVMLRVFVLTLWPIATLAAGENLGSTLGAITLADWLSLLTLTFVSGLVALLHRVRKSLEAAALHADGKEVEPMDLQRIPWWLFALCHMAGAMFVGTLMFFACEWLDLNSHLEALSIALAAWRGAKFADQWADGLSDGVMNRISAVFGNKGSS